MYECVEFYVVHSRVSQVTREGKYVQSNGRDTNQEVTMGDVYGEVDSIMSKLRVGSHKIKPCTRKYAFELPDIPKETEYLKLLYPYGGAPLAMNMTGNTFSHVFGTNTALFEQFVLWKNIMGPCWIKIKVADPRKYPAPACAGIVY